MASNPKRDKLMAEIERLRKQRQKLFANGAFGGWTKEEEAVHQTRTDRIAHLLRELEALGEEK